MPSGYTIKLHLEGADAADIYSKALPNGNDLRVVLNDQQVIERQITAFSPTAIDLLFALPAELAAGGNAQNYQLYYGNASAGAPSVNLGAIYTPVVDANTVAAYQFEETNGTTADLSGHGNTLGWSYDPTRDVAYGQFGRGVLLNGDAGLKAQTAAFPAGDQLTAEAFVRFDQLVAGPWRHMLSRTDVNTGDALWRIAVRDVNIIVAQLYVTRLSDGQVNRMDVGAINPIQANRWYHLALTYDGTTMKLWLDGHVIGQNTAAPGRPTDRFTHASAGTPVLMIGNHSHTTAAQDATIFGHVDGVRISDLARTAFPYALVAVAPTVAVGNAQVRASTGNPAEQGRSDLTIQAVRAYQRDDGAIQVEATILNQGPAAGINEPVINLAKNYTPTGPGDVRNSVNWWVNTPLAPGATATLITTIPNLATAGTTALAVQGPLAAASEITATLAVQVDALGVTLDTDPSNNLVSGLSVCQATSDAFESDGNAAQATTLAIGQTQHHNFTSQGDHDWVRFQATGGSTYTIRTANVGLSADTVVELYAANGTTVLAANDDTADGLESELVWQAPASGSFYVRVRNWNPNTVGCGTGYDLQVSDGRTGRVFLPLIVR
ncbi:MAG: LamG domain-containing protein [Chloroflexales bacterium]